MVAQAIIDLPTKGIDSFVHHAIRQILFQQLDVSQSDGSSQWVCRESMTVVKSAVLMMGPGESGVDFVRGHRRSHRQIASRQPLGQAEEIRLDAFFTTNKHCSGTTESHKNFV
tara:strand:- start:22 stop:360 length:339 start_codon:yes stop_codon:yes gene_type:complete